MQGENRLFLQLLGLEVAELKEEDMPMIL